MLSIKDRIVGEFEFGALKKITVKVWVAVALAIGFAVRIYADSEAARGEEPSKAALLYAFITFCGTIAMIVQQWQKRHGRKIMRADGPPTFEKVSVPDAWGQSLERRIDGFARQLSDVRVENINAVNGCESRLKKQADDNHVEIMAWLSDFRTRSEGSIAALQDSIDHNRERIVTLERGQAS